MNKIVRGTGVNYLFSWKTTRELGTFIRFHEKLLGNGVQLSDFMKNCSGTAYNHQISWKNCSGTKDNHRFF